MDPMTVNVLCVSGIYCIWRLYQAIQLQQKRALLRERVAYMLWMAAQQVA